MKTAVYKAEERGIGEYGWLSTRYSFSFADWYNANKMGFGTLRVINDDTILPENGFGMHEHRDMEIITIVTDGVLTHRDSMGNIGIVRAGEVQIMSAGIGIQHSEYNNEKDSTLRLFQIWIFPDTSGIKPRYDQRDYSDDTDAETLLVAPIGNSRALSVHQNAFISRLVVETITPLTYTIKSPGNGMYLFVVDGTISIEDNTLEPRDAIGITDATSVNISAIKKATVLAIEVPMQ